MKNLKNILGRTEAPEEAPALPLHEHCLSCGADLEGSRSYERYRVCHSCGFHFHLSARERLASLLDPGSFHEDDRGVTAIDPISFHGKQSYRSRIISAQRRTGLTESALTGTGSILGRDIVIAVLDFSFLGGSIGVVAGERLARAFEKGGVAAVGRGGGLFDFRHANAGGFVGAHAGATSSGGSGAALSERTSLRLGPD